MLAILLGLLSLPAASALQVGWPFMPREPPPFFAPPFFPFHNEPEGPPPPFPPTDESGPPPFLRLPLDFTRPRPPPFDRPHLRGSFLTGPFAGPRDQQRRWRMGEEEEQEEGLMARDPFMDIFAAAREKIIERQRRMSTLASVLTSAVLELPSSLSLDPEDPNDMQRVTTEERTEPAVMSEEVDATKGGRVVVTGTRTPCSLRTVISYLYGPKAEVQEAGVGDEASPSVPASSGSEALTTSRSNVAAAAEKAISRGVTRRRPIMATKQDSDMAADARAALDGTDAEKAVEVVKPQRNLDEAEAENGEGFVELKASAIPSQDQAAPRTVPTSVGGLLGMIVACVALLVVTVGAVIGLTHNRVTQRRRNDRAAFERLYQPLLVDDGPGTAPEAVLA